MGVVVSGVISRVPILKAHIIKGLITLLFSTHEPPSKPYAMSFKSEPSQSNQ